MRVLVVEDEPIIRLGIASTIEDAGHEVVEAASADEAVARLADGGIEVVVTDVDMPGSMNGIQLAHYARAHWPYLQLVVISGKVGVTQGELPAGVQFMSKPYHEPKLLSAIEFLSMRGTQA